MYKMRQRTECVLQSMKRRDDEREEKDGERVYDSDMETKYLSDYEPNSSDSGGSPSFCLSPSLVAQKIVHPVSPLRNGHHSTNIHSEISQYIRPHYIILTAAKNNIINYVFCKYTLFVITTRQSKYSYGIKSPSSEHIYNQGFTTIIRLEYFFSISNSGQVLTVHCSIAV